MPNSENLENQGFHTNPERINKEGRPKGKSITTILKELLEKKITSTDGQQLTQSEALAMKLLQKALGKGVRDETALRAIEQILDRTEGKPKQEIDQSNTGELIIKVVRERDTDKAQDTPPGAAANP